MKTANADGLRTMSRIRPGRTAAVVVAVAVLLWWCHLVLGPNLPVLLLGTAAVLGGVWTVRHRRSVAACGLIAALTAAAFGAACVVVIDRQSVAAADVVAVLTGYLLLAPVPAMVACLLRPALVSAPRSAMIGSGILLLSAAPSFLFGAYGLADVVLWTGLTAAGAVPYLRHRRAAAALTGALPTLHGWTDLGARRAPDGTRVDRLLLGAGSAVVCSSITGHRTVNDRAALAAARRAAAAAEAVGLPTDRVQPVILTTTANESSGVQRYLVNDGDLAASVIVIRPDQLHRVIEQAPRRRGRRRPVLAAALLPAPAGRSQVG